MESEATTTYKNSLTKLPHGMKVVEECYSAVQKTIAEVEDYLSVSFIVKIINIGSHGIIAVIILKFEQGGFSIPQCIQKK